ncbi:SoxR reducing system RseC family protein [Azoarcus olearius]|uniref:Sigma-E factor regulatory protein RseC n=1 Tax=Azoarcus sp. (strain BH72) TaxID=418699 RepID=A1K5Z5_AZOSB|nr:SoxR reducing system RseC family protein [Azoarcus olearius]ANQ84800.1 putative sigma-E factor regulatory protein RseC [Azoarcus olearius]CAL94250.1 putative sigma-E factor regulatory protein RseC [Azoarcus olearius]
MRAPAEVVAVRGGSAWVKVTRTGGCGRCDEPGGCRSFSLDQAFGRRDALFRLPNDIDARPGDRVDVLIAEGAPLRAALRSYGLGTVAVLVGAAVGAAVGESAPDLFAATGAAAGLGLAALLVRLAGRWWPYSAVQLARPACSGGQS